MKRKTLRYYLKRIPNYLAVVLMYKFASIIPDKLYLRILYRLKLGYWSDFDNPKTFCEKLQWLKLYDRKPEYTKMVDKAAVKNYVANIIGTEYVIPTLAIWNKPEDIEWEKLPEKFVLKTTHSGGSTGVVICKNKASLNRQQAVTRLVKSLNQDSYRDLKEWPYKNVPKRIIAEVYIDPAPNVKDLPDYKWYCFNGEPKYCQVIQDRTTHETIDFFDTDWKHQEFVGLNPAAGPAAEEPAKPSNLIEQIKIAKELSKGIPFSRIDLYSVGEKIYFGEVTFYPMSGMGKFCPEQYNEILGEMINLPGEKKRGL